MDEFIDPKLGRMIAVPELNMQEYQCAGCEYDTQDIHCPDISDGKSLCTANTRPDGRNIIWVKAENIFQ